MILNFMTKWKALFVGGKKKNYYYWLEVEAAKVSFNNI